VFEWPWEIASVKPSSMATNSAQPISRPFFFQLGFRRQDSQILSKMTPIPQFVDVSTQNCIGLNGGGREICVPQKGAESCSCHQLISERTLWFGSFLTKRGGAWVKGAANLDKEDKWHWLVGKASEQWTRVPKMDSVSRQVNFLLEVQFSNFVR
jgi:hypothetical protein